MGVLYGGVQMMEEVHGNHSGFKLEVFNSSKDRLGTKACEMILAPNLMWIGMKSGQVGKRFPTNSVIFTQGTVYGCQSKY